MSRGHVRARCRSRRRRAPARAESKSCARPSESRAADRGSARTTSRPPSGSWSIRWLTTARSRRLTRLRTTAFPTAFDTTNPTTTGPWSSGSPARCTTRESLPLRAPRRTARSKSAERRIRDAAGSTRAGSGRQLGAALAAATRKDRPSRTGTHPQPKAVGLRSAPHVRLEGPLGHDVLQLIRGSASSETNDAGLLPTETTRCTHRAPARRGGTTQEPSTAAVPRYAGRGRSVKPTRTLSGPSWSHLPDCPSGRRRGSVSRTALV